ncbi:hypothetical protein FPOAC2_14525 [Fusarium poae]|uniref:Uncharacterized protein n=1 Tax=Fusarium poae TaxID=36050 RepID=A0A1B8A990_FUSPO|nr:uncharacterized protein FPOAC1_013249 [Fusarium poae]KAG8665270.1 hypothetical protein FPOAC1_013249 [Fusarium poae]OBS15309.1 hypothetical protein FPOA_13832 [Fusarium poae]OBS16556.1 hypothetical protein FPOA_12817 [Fusarium poae]OBS17042.1 hypothetical protein FPOA_12434 [Fusarium poae]
MSTTSRRENEGPACDKRSAVDPSGPHRERLHQYPKNSLRDLLQINLDKGLFRQPVQWVDLHARLLGTQWEELPPCDTPGPIVVKGTQPSRSHLDPSEPAQALCNALTDIIQPDLDPARLSNAIKTGLGTLWPAVFSNSGHLPELDLYFGDHVYLSAVQVKAIWHLPCDGAKSHYSSPAPASTQPAGCSDTSTQSPSSDNYTTGPAIAYISKEELAFRRSRPFEVHEHPETKQNEPVIHLGELIARKLVPSNMDRDAYLVAVFLGMAQAHFYSPPPAANKGRPTIKLKEGIPPCPDFRDLKLRIVTHNTETSSFIVYTGHVTSRFLQKFHDPSYACPNDDNASSSGIKIEYTRVPVWPILGLRERLGKALGDEIVGAFNQDEMKTWEKDPGEKRGEKRKRDLCPKLPIGDKNVSSERDKRRRGPQKGGQA